MFDSTETPDLSPGDLAGAILREPITVSPTTPVMAAIALMDGARARDGATSTAQSDRPLGELDARAGCVVVVASNKVVGLLTERDVVRCCAQGQDLHQVPVSEVMTTAVQPLHEATMTDLATIMQLLRPGPMRHWPVVNEQDALVGLVTSETLQPLLSVALYKRTESLAARGQQLETETAELLNLGQRELEGHIAAHTQQLQTQLQREQVVAQLATQIRSALELQTILDNSVEQIRQILGCDRVFIYKFRPDFSGTVVAEALLGEMTSVLNVNVNDPCITPEWLEPYRQGAIRVVNDVYEASMAPCHQEMLMGIGIRAKLMVPIIVEQQLWGLMIASHQVTPRQWQPDEIKLVQQLSLQVSIAIQQALIYKRLQHELRARQQAKNRLQIKSDLLALVATQDSLTDTLTQICLTIEEVLPGALCSVLLVDRTNRLQEGAAPSLPAPYRRQIQGVSAEEGIGSCGTAAHRRAPVIVADIANDALWQNFKDLALAADLRACWSTPILTADGEVLGTFGIYYREVRSPQADDLALLENVTDVVALAILRHRNDLTLKQTNQRLQEAQHIAHLGNWELDLQHNTLYWSEEIFHIFEIDPQSSDASYAAFLKVVHPDDRPLVDATYRNHLCDLQPYSLVHRLQMPDGRIKYVRRQCETTFNTEGMPLVSRGTVQDITQQQLAEMRRERAETSLRQVIEGTAACTGEEFFPALVRHIAEALDVRCVAVSRATSEGLQALAFFKDGKLCPPPWLPYDAVPYCQQTLQTGSCCYPAGVQSCYPGNSLLADLEVESYLGVGLRSAIGDPPAPSVFFMIAPDRPRLGQNPADYFCRPSRG
jgi:GAF domain-containing protein/CBS domain-containing protein